MTMSRWLLVIAGLLLFGCASAPSTPAAKMPPSVDVTGRWNGSTGAAGWAAEVFFDLKQDGEKVTGRSTVPGSGNATGDLTGTVSGDVFTYILTGNRCCGELIVKGDQMNGRGYSGYPMQLQRAK